MRFKLIKILLIGFLFLGACDTGQDYDKVPSIEFESYEKLGKDSAIRFTISYVDGDGNLGLKESMTNPPFDTGSRYFNNMFIEYYEQYNGEFHQTTDDPFRTDTISYPYRFPYITPEGRNKSIKGEIEVSLTVDIATQNFPDRDYGGQVLFKFTIVDRDLNHSNTVSSPPIPFEADK